MVQISEVSIISIDKNDESWAIEGEILFEEDLSTAFEITYLPVEEEFEDLVLEINPGKYDVSLLYEMILNSVDNFEEY